MNLVHLFGLLGKSGQFLTLKNGTCSTFCLLIHIFTEEINTEDFCCCTVYSKKLICVRKLRKLSILEFKGSQSIFCTILGLNDFAKCIWIPWSSTSCKDWFIKIRTRTVVKLLLFWFEFLWISLYLKLEYWFQVSSISESSG